MMAEQRPKAVWTGEHTQLAMLFLLWLAGLVGAVVCKLVEAKVPAGRVFACLSMAAFGTMIFDFLWMTFRAPQKPPSS